MVGNKNDTSSIKDTWKSQNELWPFNQKSKIKKRAFKYQLLTSELHTYSTKVLRHLPLQETTKKFLNLVGIPEETFPFIIRFKTKGQKFKSIALLDKLGSEFNHLIYIGYDETNNPICIDSENNDHVVWLNQKYAYKKTFYNSSLMHFVKSVIMYRQFIIDVERKYGHGSFWKKSFKKSDINKLERSLKKADFKAFENANYEGSMWWRHLDELRYTLDVAQDVTRSL